MATEELQAAEDDLAEQLQQAQEKHARDAAICRLYTNPHAPEYFAQFETSHR